jgi:hypothetical protein
VAALSAKIESSSQGMTWLFRFLCVVVQAHKSKAIEKERTMEALVLSNLSFFTRSGVLKHLGTARVRLAQIFRLASPQYFI